MRRPEGTPLSPAALPLTGARPCDQAGPGVHAEHLAIEHTSSAREDSSSWEAAWIDLGGEG